MSRCGFEMCFLTGKQCVARVPLAQSVLGAMSVLGMAVLMDVAKTETSRRPRHQKQHPR